MKRFFLWVALGSEICLRPRSIHVLAILRVRRTVQYHSTGKSKRHLGALPVRIPTPPYRRPLSDEFQRAGSISCNIVLIVLCWLKLNTV